jgi:integrase
MKTRNSRRIVPLPPFALEALREHARMQAAERRRIGASRGADGFVFGEPDGSPMSPDRLSSKFYWTVRKLGLPTVSLQGLRHTFATVHGEIGTRSKCSRKAWGIRPSRRPPTLT